MALRPQPIRLRLQPTELWVNEVLAFANLEDPTKVRPPEISRTYDDGLMELNTDSPAVWIDPEKSSLLHVLRDLEGIGEDNNIAESQARLRELLRILTADGKTTELDQLLADAIGVLRVRGSFTYTQAGLRFRSLMQFRSPDQWWGVGLAALIESDLVSRVRQCRRNRCEAFLMDWPGRGGQPRYYCCKEHQNAERQQRYRENAQKKRRQRQADQSLGD